MAGFGGGESFAFGSRVFAQVEVLAIDGLWRPIPDFGFYGTVVGGPLQQYRTGPGVNVLPDEAPSRKNYAPIAPSYITGDTFENVNSGDATVLCRFVLKRLIEDDYSAVEGW